MMELQAVQIAVFLIVTGAIGLITFLKCRQAAPPQKEGVSAQNKEVFLAGGGLTWVFVAGSITLTNLSTDQLVGMNGNQMALLAWWEFSAVVGLIILAKVFLPIYYRYRCTTTTELLEKRYQNHHISALIAVLFLLGNIFIFLPSILYGGSLFLINMFDLDVSIMTVSIVIAFIGACYAVLGGLRAVAISDTYSGVLLLSLGMLVVFLALAAIDWDFSGIPAERLTLIGDSESPIPWHTLLTGMIFIQIFYWSTNQTITQRAMASPSLGEAQKGVFVAAIIRFLIVPPMIVLPGIVSYKLYGDIGDTAYGRIVGDILPLWLSGAFAAALLAAALTSFNSILNSSAALYVCDIHEKYFNKKPSVARLNALVTAVLVFISLALVPVFSTADSLINLVQQLYGLLSMPILSCFILGLAFRDVDYRAAMLGVVFGVAMYGLLTALASSTSAPIGLGVMLQFSGVGLPAEPLVGLHYIHLMFATLITSVPMALLINLLVFKRRAKFGWVEEATVA
jgi:SSS family solute:Na+ symporter